jgi:Glyoxalase-like domain
MPWLGGSTARAGGTHPGQGTHNALLALGAQTCLEIIAPDSGQPAPTYTYRWGRDLAGCQP